MASYDERHAFWKWVIVFTVFSGLGSLFVVVAIIIKLRKDFSSRFVLYLCLADFLLSVICLILCAYNYSHGHIQDKSHLVCILQPIITWYFMEASILWLAVISFNSYTVVFYKHPLVLKQEVVANLICWGLPMITVFLPLGNAGESYGPRNGLWCSFSEHDKRAQLINILFYYIPCLILIIYCYTCIMFTIKDFGRTKAGVISNNDTMKAVRRMFMFVLAYFVVWTPLTISYIYEYSTDKYISFAVEFIVDNLIHIQGIVNFVLYGLNRDVITNGAEMIKEGWKTIAFSLQRRSSNDELV